MNHPNKGTTVYEMSLWVANFTIHHCRCKFFEGIDKQLYLKKNCSTRILPLDYCRTILFDWIFFSYSDAFSLPWKCKLFILVCYTNLVVKLVMFTRIRKLNLMSTDFFLNKTEFTIIQWLSRSEYYNSSE